MLVVGVARKSGCPPLRTNVERLADPFIQVELRASHKSGTAVVCSYATYALWSTDSAARRA